MNGLIMSTASRRIGGKVYTTFRFVSLRCHRVFRYREKILAGASGSIFPAYPVGEEHWDSASFFRASIPWPMRTVFSVGCLVA
jgi:hypothetical protein